MYKSRGYYVYILANKRNGALYAGVTNDLFRRIQEHQNGTADSFSKKYKINKLVYYDWTNSISAALAREKQFKNWKREWKIQLIEKENPSWRDLFFDMLPQKKKFNS